MDMNYTEVQEGQTAYQCELDSSDNPYWYCNGEEGAEPRAEENRLKAKRWTAGYLQQANLVHGLAAPNIQHMIGLLVDLIVLSETEEDQHYFIDAIDTLDKRSRRKV